MNANPIKFKRRKAWNELGRSHYLTFSTYHKKPSLLDDRKCKPLAKSINAQIRQTIQLDCLVLLFFCPNGAIQISLAAKP
jgi:hypothetical protein